MGLFTKTNHEKDYLYFLIGKKQFYLGPKDRPGEINKQNLYKAIKEANRNADASLDHYTETIAVLLPYLSDKEKSDLIEERVSKLKDKITELK